MSNFRPIGDVDRGSETQLQVGEKLNYLIERFMPYSAKIFKKNNMDTKGAVKFYTHPDDGQGILSCHNHSYLCHFLVPRVECLNIKICKCFLSN